MVARGEADPPAGDAVVRQAGGARRRECSAPKDPPERLRPVLTDSKRQDEYTRVLR